MDKPNKLDEAFALLSREVEELRNDNESLRTLVKGLTARLESEKNADADREWATELAHQVAEVVVKRISGLQK